MGCLAPGATHRNREKNRLCSDIMSSKEHKNTWKLLHPELLSRDELLCTLAERHVKVDEKIPQKKELLVELFKKIAMPQVQRSCFKDKTTKMEVEEQKKGKPSRLASKLDSSQSVYWLRQNLTVQETSCSARDGSSNNSNIDVGNQLKRVNNKRSAFQMSEHCVDDGTNPQKREKITWP